MFTVYQMATYNWMPMFAMWQHIKRMPKYATWHHHNGKGFAIFLINHLIQWQKKAQSRPLDGFP
jgi:hypothetical protein